MAVVDCAECGGAVSQAAAACPHCGDPRTPLGGAASIGGGIGVAAGSALRLGGRVLRTLLVLAGAFVVLILALKLFHKNAPPQTLMNERIELDEGKSRYLSFHLATPREVHVQMDAQPKPVNVYLFNADEWGEFNQHIANPLGGGRFHYNTALSQEGTMMLSKTATIPEGDWHIAVERPREAIFFKDASVVTIKVTEK